MYSAAAVALATVPSGGSRSLAEQPSKSIDTERWQTANFGGSLEVAYMVKKKIWDSRLELGYDSKIIPGNPTFRILVLNLDFLL